MGSEFADADVDESAGNNAHHIVEKTVAGDGDGEFAVKKFAVGAGRGIVKRFGGNDHGIDGADGVFDDAAACLETLEIVRAFYDFCRLLDFVKVERLSDMRVFRCDFA